MAEKFEALTFDRTKCGLIVFDMLEAGRPEMEEQGILQPVFRLLDGCRKIHVPVFFVGPDHRADGRDLALTLPDVDQLGKPLTPEDYSARGASHGGAGSPALLPLSDFAMSEDDYYIKKHRWSAFYATSLELSLRTLGIDTIILAGSRTYFGIASTVYSARDMDYQIVVVSDGCVGSALDLSYFMENCFPYICHVRTADEVLAKLL